MSIAPLNPLVVCLLQPPLRRDDRSPLDATRETIALMHKALAEAENKVDLILLPELCPVGYSEDSFARFLPTTMGHRALHVEIDSQMQQAAKQMNCAICYGAMGWDRRPDNNDSLEYTIRQIAVDHEGNRLAAYDKIHVCDYGDCMETRFFTPGKALCSFEIKGWKFGLMICADMRYPLLAQTLVQRHGVHVLLQPASFARDCSFRTWKSFRETRAVECGVYYLATNYAGDYYGQTSMNPPWIDEEHEPIVLGTDVSYLVATLDPKVLEEARTQFPFYQHSTMASTSCPSCGSSEAKG